MEAPQQAKTSAATEVLRFSTLFQYNPSVKRGSAEIIDNNG
jgi:hypothetical protein